MPLTVHHLHSSSSERVVWLCEELGVAYELRTYARDPVLAPAEYKALHPLGTSPVIQDDVVSVAAAADPAAWPATTTITTIITLAESGACVEYICRVHGGSRLLIPPGAPAYPDFLLWFHWANGSFQSALGRAMQVRSAGISADNNLLARLATQRMDGGLRMLDNRLGETKAWLAGEEFSAADVMVVFSLTTFRRFFPYSLRGYDNIVSYLRRIGDREAYRRAMAKCDPDLQPVLGSEPPNVAGL